MTDTRMLIAIIVMLAVGLGISIDHNVNGKPPIVVAARPEYIAPASPEPRRWADLLPTPQATTEVVKTHSIDRACFGYWNTINLHAENVVARDVAEHRIQWILIEYYFGSAMLEPPEIRDAFWAALHDQLEEETIPHYWHWMDRIESYGSTEWIEMEAECLNRDQRIKDRILFDSAKYADDFPDLDSVDYEPIL